MSEASTDIGKRPSIVYGGKAKSSSVVPSTAEVIWEILPVIGKSNTEAF